jgi:hypothetical protein
VQVEFQSMISDPQIRVIPKPDAVSRSSVSAAGKDEPASISKETRIGGWTSTADQPVRCVQLFRRHVLEAWANLEPLWRRWAPMWLYPFPRWCSRALASHSAAAHFLRKISLFTSGQNSASASLAISPVIPHTHRNAAFSGPFSLGARHVLERKLLPTFPAKRA